MAKKKSKPSRPAKNKPAAKKSKAGKLGKAKPQRIKLLFTSSTSCECELQEDETFTVTVTAEVDPPVGGATNDVEATLLDADGHVLHQGFLHNTSGNIWTETFEGQAECPATVRLDIQSTIHTSVSTSCSCTNCQ
jgi:hypothetical protein